MNKKSQTKTVKSNAAQVLMTLSIVGIILDIILSLVLVPVVNLFGFSALLPIFVVMILEIATLILAIVGISKLKGYQKTFGILLLFVSVISLIYSIYILMGTLFDFSNSSFTF